MRPVFVQTQNYHRFMDGLSGLAARGADECRLVVVDGKPGLGKTFILERWAAMEACVYLRAKADWAPNWLLSELLEGLQIQPPRSHQERFNKSLEALAQRQASASLARRQFAVVVDEADYVSCKPKLIDTIRDLADLAGVPFVLVGMGRIKDNLTRFPQTASRISRYVRFDPAELDDVTKFLDEVCEIKVGPDLARFVLQATGGYNREIREAIKSIERFGYRNAPADEAGLSLREMAGVHLIYDRKTGLPIMVPGGAK